uniref:Uncharacterized protein n=1 Tax=Amphimedon queenslandica TaxID=400682 RepID=A0A1X7UV09_AMPQE
LSQYLLLIIIFIIYFINIHPYILNPYFVPFTSDLGCSPLDSRPSHQLSDCHM